MLTNPEAAGALRCRLANGHDGACLPPVTRGRFNDADWTPPAGEGAAEPDCEHEYERGIESCAECDQTRGRHESWCGEGAAEQPQCMCPANEVGGIHHPSCPVRGVPQGR